MIGKFVGNFLRAVASLAFVALFVAAPCLLILHVVGDSPLGWGLDIGYMLVLIAVMMSVFDSNS